MSHKVPESSRLQSVVLRSPLSEVLFSRVGENGLEIRPMRDEGTRFGLVDVRGLREALDALYPSIEQLKNSERAAIWAVVAEMEARTIGRDDSEMELWVKALRSALLSDGDR